MQFAYTYALNADSSILLYKNTESSPSLFHRIASLPVFIPKNDTAHLISSCPGLIFHIFSYRKLSNHILRHLAQDLILGPIHFRKTLILLSQRQSQD